MSVSGPESSLWDILLSYFQLMVSRSDVNLGENTRSLQLVEQIVDSRERILILDSHLIQFPVVDAQA